MKRHLGIVLWVLFLCVGCDHAVKHAAERVLADAGIVDWFGGVVRFQLVANPGAFLSLGAELPELARKLLLVGFVPLALLGAGIAMLRAADVTRAQALAFGLIAGGGLANWLDRVRGDGAVTDYVSIGVGWLRTGIFNVADVAIVAGLVVFLWAGSKAREEAAPEAGSA